MRRGAKIVATVLLGMTAITGCAVDGHATRGPVDLDTGEFGSQQSSALSEATGGIQWAKLRGIRFADHLVFPRDVDGGLVEIKLPLQPLAAPNNIAAVLGGNAADLPVVNRFEYGYTVTAGEKGEGALGFSHAVMVFDSPEAAEAAADDFAKAVMADDEYTTDVRSRPIAGVPDGTRTVQFKTVIGETAIGFTPIGSMLMYSWGQAKDFARAETIVKTALVKQKSLLEPMPTISDDRNADPTGLIRGTVAGENGGDPLERSVYGPRGAALQSNDQPAAYAAMSKAGVTAAAQDGTHAYRTAGKDQTKGLADFLLKYAGGYSDAKAAASPRDLPSARCWSYVLDYDARHGCVVEVDRYVGESTGKTLKEAQQKIAAQSVFLAEL